MLAPACSAFGGHRGSKHSVTGAQLRDMCAPGAMELHEQLCEVPGRLREAFDRAASVVEGGKLSSETACEETCTLGEQGLCRGSSGTPMCLKDLYLVEWRPHPEYFEDAGTAWYAYLPKDRAADDPTELVKFRCLSFFFWLWLGKWFAHRFAGGWAGAALFIRAGCWVHSGFSFPLVQDCKRAQKQHVPCV